jgi:WD40 repeat protein
MKKRFEDRISDLSLPSTAGETPAVSAIERSRDGWKLTRRSVMGLLAAGAFAGLPRAAASSICGPGAFAHNIQIDGLSFFPNGQTLVSAGQDGMVKFWTVPGGALFRAISTEAVPEQVAVSPDGSQIAVAMAGGQLQLWSANGVTRRALAGHSGTVQAVAFTPDSAQLISVSVDRTTKVWSVAHATLVHSFVDATDVMAQVAVPQSALPRLPVARQPAPLAGAVPPRRYFVTSGAQLYLRLLATGATLRTVAGKAFAISPDGALLAAHDGLRLYMYTFSSLTPLVSVVENRTATSLAFSADGTRLAIAYSDAPARLYSAPDLTLVRDMEANDGPCLAAAMDSQNAYLAVGSGKSIRLYQLPSGARVPVCFMDIAASASTCRGSQYTWAGALYTVACGTGFPEAVSCNCDCVPGNCPCVYDTGCSCDSDTGCGCDSNNPCSCVSDTGCGCVGNVGCSCNSDYGCGCVDDYGCGCDGDFGGCGCDGDSGGGCGCDGD